MSSIDPGIQRTALAQEKDPVFPLFLPTVFIYGERTPFQIFFAGDNIQLGMLIKNENRISANITFLTQIIGPTGVTEAIQMSKGALTSNNETLKLVNYWIPEHDSVYYVEAFLLESSKELPRPLSEKWTTDIPVRSKHNDSLHDLRVEVHLDNPNNVVAGDELRGSAELVNYANHPESVSASDGSVSVRPKGADLLGPISGDCFFSPGSQLDDFEVLPGDGGRLKLNEGNSLPIHYSLDHEDSYDLIWYGTVHVQEADGVDCYYLVSSPANVNITAPRYDKIKLVLDTDKGYYSRYEPVKFTIFIENSSDEPLKINLDEIMIHVRDVNSNNILWISAGLSSVAGGSDSGIPSVVVFTSLRMSP